MAEAEIALPLIAQWQGSPDVAEELAEMSLGELVSIAIQLKAAEEHERFDGRHCTEVLRALGLSDEAISELLDKIIEKRRTRVGLSICQ